MTLDGVEPCGLCQPMYEIACETCGGSGVEQVLPPSHSGWTDFAAPDWCSACGGCGSSWVPAHPIGEAHA